MIAEVAEKRSEVIALCEQYEVIRLALFGSAARGDFDPAKSDLDFLVLFDRRDNPDYVDRFLDLADALEALFKSKGRSGHRALGAITSISSIDRP